MIDFTVYKHSPNITKDFTDDSILNYVVYSHSSFLDVLQIQTDYLSGLGRLTLLINENNLDLTHMYSRYDNVIFYKDNQSYGHKLLSCINQIDYEYFVFIHDNDILFHVDKIKMLEFFSFLKENNFDRIDFQLAYDYDSIHGHEINNDGLYLIKSSNTDTTAKGYPYNVNPSIWKRETLKSILEKFGHHDYRTIEAPETQNFAVQFNIFKLYSNKKFNCGYFVCLEPVRYLHITHYQKFLSLSTLPHESYKDIEDEYNKIINKYNLKNSNKWIR